MRNSQPRCRVHGELLTAGRLAALALLLWAASCGRAQPVGPDAHAVASWTFEGSLADQTGRGNDALATTPKFVAGQQGSALQAAERGALVPDAPDLRLAPGLRLECWLKPTRPHSGITYIVAKDQEYMLRLDPPGEGGRISFFVYLDGNWEPRVQSDVAPQIGQWYHLIAGWDGQNLSLEVDGKVWHGQHSGTVRTAYRPLQLGPCEGLLDEVRLDNPGANATAEAVWPFAGDLHDASGHGHDGTAEGAQFVPGTVGQALGPLAQPLVVPDSEALRIAPGFHLDCRVRFDQVPADLQTIVAKEGEFMLRVNPPSEGSALAFFVSVGGWEPRVSASERVRPHEWYRVQANWDGVVLTLEVNGVQTHVSRGGLCRGGNSPLTIGGPGLTVDEVRLDNPRRPTLRVARVTQEHAILRTGTPETLTAVVQNLSGPVTGAALRLDVPDTVRCLDNPASDLGALGPGEQKTVQWRVTADRETSSEGVVRLTADGATPAVVRRPLVFFPPDDQAATSRARREPPSHGGKTYYVDSVDGRNANTGLSEAQAWQDFTPVNGLTLGPGDALLLKRGSVFRQELSVSAHGTADNWAVIGTYGTGPRPIIRRDWDIDDRCALLKNADYLRVSSLVVCYAGKGLVAYYDASGHKGLLIEDCVAHHIEGLYRPNANGIPEWLDRDGAEGDGLHTSVGIGLAGARAEDVVLRNCEMFQTSSGFMAMGDGVIVDRVYCHDNYVRNTSPHPYLVNVRRTYLQNSIFDASGWHASAGTMGIMLGDPRGLIMRNCTWRNQPDSGSHDEGGVDFEAGGDGCLVDHCTFQNNAGAAIEVLGLRSPQTRNVEIAHSRFLANNTAHKLGPGEIYVWGGSADPDICCSNGVVHDNGYVTVPGVEFFVNQAPKTTTWTLRDNTAYASIAEADKALPFNAPPEVDAGRDQRTNGPRVRLTGSVRDDHRSGAAPLQVRWEVLEGPGAVTFADAAAPATEATFAVPGDYLLRLVADDGELWLSDMVTIHRLPPGATVAQAWEFNTPLDKEGWSEADLGTQFRKWEHPDWSTTSDPVQYVAGGYYLVALENSTSAHLLSADDLGVDLSRSRIVTLRLQNHTPATHLRLRFTTAANPSWQEARGKDFAVVPNDTGPRVYTVDLGAVPGWSGRLKQLRLDLTDGVARTGTCRLDYLWLGSR